MNVQNQIRNKIQEKAVLISRTNNHIVLEWATGVGKTLGALRIVEDIISINKEAKGYLICKEHTHVDNWNRDISKHNKDHLKQNLTTFLYASLKHHKDVLDFIILDECHAITGSRLMHLRQIIGPETKVIYLSATIPYAKKHHIFRLSNDTAKYCTVSLSWAMANKLLPVPKIIVHQLQLDNSDKKRHFLYKFRGGKNPKTCDYKDMWESAKIYKHCGLKIRCNEKEYYELLGNKINYYQSLQTNPANSLKDKELYKNTFLKLSLERKEWMCELKLNKAVEIVEQFRNDKKRFIAFTGTISQSELMGKGKTVNSYHSKDENKDSIDDFNYKVTNELFAVKMLRESVNLVDVDSSLIIQLDSQVLTFIQMLGRVLRSDNPEAHLILMRGTQDEKYFNEVTKDLNKTLLTYK